MPGADEAPRGPPLVSAGRGAARADLQHRRGLASARMRPRCQPQWPWPREVAAMLSLLGLVLPTLRAP